MKKFLTVLLALSVVFTYTVGSAFAVSIDDTATASSYAKTRVQNAVDKAALAHADDYSAGTIAYAKEETTKLAINNVVNDLIAVIDYQDSNDFDMDTFKADIDIWSGFTTGTLSFIGNDNAGSKDLTYAKSSVDALFVSIADAADPKYSVLDAKAVLNAINLDDFSNREVTIDGVDTTYRKQAEKLIADAKDALDDVKADSCIELNGMKAYHSPYRPADITNYEDAINGILYGYKYQRGSGAANPLKVVTIYSESNKVTELPTESTAIPASGDFSTVGVVAGVIGKLETLLKVADEPAIDDADKVELEHAKETFAYYAKVTYFNTYVAAKKEDDVTSRTEDYAYNAAKQQVAGVTVANPKNITAAEANAINAAIMEDINKTIEVVNVKLANAENPMDVATAYTTLSGFYANVIKKALDAIDEYEDVVDDANDMKEKYLVDGTKMYDDTAIDEAVAKDKEDIYANFDNTTRKDYLSKVPTAYDEVIVALNAALNKWQASVDTTGEDKTAEADKKYCKDYYVAGAGADYDVIEAETKAALYEVKSVEEINTIMAKADARLAELRTADDAVAVATEIAKYTKALKEYADEQWELVAPDAKYLESSFRDDTKNSALAAGIELLNEAAKVEDVAAAYEEAKTLFKDIKTKAELREQAAAVTALVGDLAAVSKDLSNEDKFMAAAKAYDAYLNLYGADKTDIVDYMLFEKKLETLKDYQENAIEDAIEDMDAENAAEVKAVREKLSEYLDFYDVNAATYDGTEDAYGTLFEVSNYDELSKAEAGISSAECKAVIRMIAKLTTASSMDEILAAKDAYDALSGLQQRIVKEHFGTAWLYKLELMETAKIKAVESLKIVTSTKLYTKSNKIRVNWKIKDGDASAITGYQVYKSTKAQTGYKFMGKTTKSYMDNKKNLKKGQRYFYKVRAYVDVDGERYYSDWSNKGNRIYK